MENLESITQDCNVQSRNLNKFCLKQNMIYNQIPLDQKWILPILHEILKVKDDHFVDNEIATITRAAVVHLNFRAGSTFPVPVIESDFRLNLLL